MKRRCVLGREGFEPSKAELAELQSDPFGHLGICPCKENFTTGMNVRQVVI